MELTRMQFPKMKRSGVGEKELKSVRPIPEDEALAESDIFKVIKIIDGIDQNAIPEDEA